MLALCGELLDIAVHGVNARHHGGVFLIVLVIGTSLQIVLLGPSRLEILKSLKLNHPRKQIRIGEAYLAFEMNRGERLIVVCFILGLLSWSTGLFSMRGQAGVLVFFLAFSTFIGGRLYVLRYRVKNNLFGHNEYEARMLLVFLQKLYVNHRNENFPPPGKMKDRRETVEDAVTVPEAATFAT